MTGPSSVAPRASHAVRAPVTSDATQRIDAVDVLRGIAIVLMVVDHAREYSAGTGRVTDPMDLNTVSPLLFWMRWCAHFCAPVFTLCAGLSVGLQSTGIASRALAQHVAVRGLVLIVLEFTVIHFAWTFSLVWPMLYAQVIWGLGISLLALSALLAVPWQVRVVVGVALVAGHNLFDNWHVSEPPVLRWLWAILHDRQVLPLMDGLRVRTSYPVLPMIGLVLIGDAVGRWYRRTPDVVVRQRWLVRAGLACVLLFIALRSTGIYGDPHPATFTGAPIHDLMALLNATKYPMSLAFVMMTIGPACLLLAWLDTRRLPLQRWFALIGSVPMFLYITHLYAIHAAALLAALVVGFPLSAFDFRATISGVPAAFGFPLWMTLPFAIGTTVALLPAARWYAALRRSRRFRITRYI
jgi:uncharacterized membrane protein